MLAKRHRLGSAYLVTALSIEVAGLESLCISGRVVWLPVEETFFLPHLIPSTQFKQRTLATSQYIGI